MALISRVTTWVASQTLTASALNAEFQNIIDKITCDYVDDASADSTAMQAVEDPYPGAVISLSTNLKEEIRRLRYQIKQMNGQTQWYIDCVGSLSTGGITTSNLASNAVTTVKITDSNVTTAKIADGAVTAAKRAALTYTLSSSCGLFNTASTSYTDVTNLSCSITTTGRPVRIQIVSDASGSGTSHMACSLTTGFAGGVAVKILRGATEVGQYFSGNFITGGSTHSNYAPVSSINYIDVPSAGTYTYKVQIKCYDSNTTQASMYYAKLFVYEL